MTAPRRGDVYWVDFNPARGSEQAGRRPAVVISLDSFNSRMPVAVVAAVTSKVKGMQIAVRLPAGHPLPLESEVMPWQIVTVAQERLDGFVGRLTALQIAELESKLRICWGL